MWRSKLSTIYDGESTIIKDQNKRFYIEVAFA